MKPLLHSQLPTFLQRFNSFKESEFRSLEILSATSIKLTYALQDEAKEFDWITLTLLFDGLSDAKLLPTNQMEFINMEDGISLFYEDTKFFFGNGIIKKSDTIADTSYFIVAKTIKFEEGVFS